jgi:hypothetical protein
VAVTSSSHPHPPPIFDFPIPIPPLLSPAQVTCNLPSIPPSPPPPLPECISNFVDCVFGDIFATCV